MARPRKPRAARKPRAPRVTGTYQATTGSVGGGELGSAAEEIAETARRLAAWSQQVATSIAVDVDEGAHRAVISTDAAPAYPNEVNARHPVFARGADRTKWTWVAGNDRPFLAPAADRRAGAAMAKYAQKIDRLCRERGFS
jgi:hypothetical protein